MVRITGHRGAAALAPENTLAGINLAIDLGVDLIECDVRLTKDDHLIAMHDETVDRTTNGSGKVAEMTFTEIRSLDAGRGEQVPTLAEVLQTVKGKVGLLCELKGEGVEESAVRDVLAEGMQGEVIFTSFHFERLERIKSLGTNLQIGAILSNPSEEDIDRALALGVVSVCIHFRNLSLAMGRRVRDAGKAVRAWNPDTIAEQQAMLALGVTDISSNRPDILLDYIRSPQAAAVMGILDSSDGDRR